MEPAEKPDPHGRPLGRYVLYDEFAIGGMATVHFGRLRGQGGFSRTVAIKRLHPPYARDPSFAAMLVEEARLAARVQHPNVVAPLDVVAVDDKELLLVMEYVHGEALARLLGSCARRSSRVPPPIAVSVMAGLLYGLHAAHEAVSDQGEPLQIVHRDVSPQNVLVGVDGVARVLDFGVAKATSRSSASSPGTTKGKLSYMSPEQLRFKTVDRRADVFAAGIVLWEMLTLRRLFRSDDPGLVAMKILKSDVPVPSRFNPHVPRSVDAVVAGALARNRDARYGTALTFAQALEQAVPPASPREVGDWVQATAAESLAQRSRLRARVESAAGRDAPTAPPPARSSVAGSLAVPPPLREDDDESVTVRARTLDLVAYVPPPPMAPEPPTVVVAAALTTTVETFSSADVVESIETTLNTPPPPLDLGATPSRPWRNVPSRAWGALGIGALAATIVFAVILPRGQKAPPPRAVAATPPAIAQPVATPPATAAIAPPAAAPPAIAQPVATPPAAALPVIARPVATPALAAPVSPQVEPLPLPEPPAEKVAAIQRPQREGALTNKLPVVSTRAPDDSEPEVVLQDDHPPVERLQAGPARILKPRPLPGRRWRARKKMPIFAFPDANDDCTPPYVLDERGIRRIKPECLTSP